MIDREEIKYITNILALDNQDVNLDNLHTVVRYLEQEDISKFLDFMLTEIENADFFKTIFIQILKYKNKSSSAANLASLLAKPKGSDISAPASCARPVIPGVIDVRPLSLLASITFI